MRGRVFGEVAARVIQNALGSCLKTGTALANFVAWSQRKRKSGSKRRNASYRSYKRRNLSVHEDIRPRRRALLLLPSVAGSAFPLSVYSRVCLGISLRVCNHEIG